MKHSPTLVGILLLALAGSLQAAPLGTAFNYQGKLSDGTTGATGLFDFQFAVYDAATLGSQVGPTLNQSAVPVTNGLFLATLDFGPGMFDGNARWLAVSVKTNGAVSLIALTPRQPLTPTPYAFYSPLAGTATAAGTATTATTAGTATLANSVANNAVTASGIQAGQVVKNLNGLTDQVLLSAGTNVLLRTNGNSLAVSAGPWLPSNATNTWFSGGRVGIGKTPLYGALDVFDGTGSNGAGGNIHVGGSGANGDPKLIHFGDMLSSSLGYVYLGENGQDDTMELRAERFYFNNGNVGIFKTNPATALDVNGTITANTFVGNFSGNGAGLTDLDASDLTIGNVADARLSANVALLNNNQTFAGQKNFSQAVGIGTVAPFDALLDIEGDARLNLHELYLREGSDRFHGLGWYGAIKLFGGINVDGPVLYGFDGGGVGTTGAGTTNLALRWRTGGNVIIDPHSLNSGALTPGLTFGDGSGEGIASRRTAGDNQYGLDFYTVYQPRMTIANSGDVGIGTRTPAAKLDVIGMVKTPTVGTLDTTPFTAVIDNMAGLRLEAGNLNWHSTYKTLNVTLGSPLNYISPNSADCTIGGGGAGGGATNSITGYVGGGTIGGGYANTIVGGNGSGDPDNGSDFSAISGGGFNRIYASISTISGGSYNDIQYNGRYSFIGGGGYNKVQTNAYYSVIGGGYENVIENCYKLSDQPGYRGRSAILGGENNAIQSNAVYCAIGGGYYNRIQTNAEYCTIGGGARNTIVKNAVGATIPGGDGNYVGNLGTNSFAAGTRAKALRSGLFVWADSSPYDFEPYGMSAGGYANSFNVRATGGIYFVTGVDGTGRQNAGPICAAGGGSFTSYCDRNAKENFAAVSGREILERVAAMPIETWNYKAQDASIRHIGPMAQDFKAGFGVGETDKGITTIDADGVALAAIQGLNQKVDEQALDKDARIKTLESKVAELQALIEKLAKQNGGEQ